MLQSTFCIGPIFTGGFASAEMPEPFAPRNCGQFGVGVSAAISAEVAMRNGMAERNGVLIGKMCDENELRTRDFPASAFEAQELRLTKSEPADVAVQIVFRP